MLEALVFSDSLLESRNTLELVKSLKSLRTKLAAINQDNVDKSSLGQIRQDLIAPRLMQHKDKGVRVLVACCASDLLRLYAPDPPFDQTQLKHLFALFFKQLHGIGDSTGVYFSDYYYLLDSICTVRSVTLLADLNADQLVIDLVRDMLDIITYAN